LSQMGGANHLAQFFSTLNREARQAR
jgi:hypothetical protein